MVRRWWRIGLVTLWVACGDGVVVGSSDAESSSGTSESDDGFGTFDPGSTDDGADSTGDIEEVPARLLLHRRTDVGMELAWAEVTADGMTEPQSLHPELDATTEVGSFDVLPRTHFVALRTDVETDDVNLYVASIEGGLQKVDAEPASVQDSEWVEGASTLVYTRLTGDAFYVSVDDDGPGDAVAIEQVDGAEIDLRMAEPAGDHIAAVVRLPDAPSGVDTCFVARVDPADPTAWTAVHDPSEGRCTPRGFTGGGLVYETDSPSNALWWRSIDGDVLGPPALLAEEADDYVEIGPLGVVFRSGDAERKVYFVDIEAGEAAEPVLLSEPDSDAESYHVTDDGRRVGVQRAEGGVIVDLAAPDLATEPIVLPEPYVSRPSSWFEVSADERWVFTLGQRADDEFRKSLWRVDRTTGAAQMIQEGGGGGAGVSLRDVAADSSAIGFALTSINGANSSFLCELTDEAVGESEFLLAGEGGAFAFAPTDLAYGVGDIEVHPRDGDWSATYDVFHWTWWDAGD